MTDACAAGPALLVCGSAADVIEPLTGLLAELGYTRVTVLGDTAQVLAALPRNDLLLLDIGLPDGAAGDLIRRVREIKSASAFPILLISSTSCREARNAALDAGANEFLDTPVDSAELALRIKNLLSLQYIYQAHLAIHERQEHEVKQRTAKLNLLIENGLMVSMERDRTKLLRHIIFEGRRLLNCDGGTIYLVAERKYLHFALRTRDDKLPSIIIPLYDPDSGAPNEKYVSTWVALHNRPVLIDDVYQETRFDLSGTRHHDAESAYRTVSMLTVPMAPRNGEVIGVVQFMNAKDPASGAIIPFAADLVPLVEALASQAAVALDNQQLLDAQKALMESMIRVIATAIDAKSPYTGRHCERMPVLGLMLAEEACQSQSGQLAAFNFRNEDEWREFRIGAWLHDCGKVTTPEYVIDKATKLETIYNRIHEIRMRFEVLLRDATIERLESLAAGEDAGVAEARFAARYAQLQSDFAFIAENNAGSEMMSAERIERLLRIAAQTWQRHFDDRIGLSQEELSRFCDAPPTLPVTEQLLADKAEHLIPRESTQPIDPAYGFKVVAPEHLYNHGEIYNLSIRHGTLTDEERYKINEHMIQGIMMLEQMPFPNNLRRVPEYAGNHHEALNGRGYPRRLSAAELSVPARILAIADVFEALTAPDRPYKKPNKLSEALHILHRMKTDGHIDPALFDLFLTSGVYLRYAEQFLKAEQIDTVDIAAFLG